MRAPVAQRTAAAGGRARNPQRRSPRALALLRDPRVVARVRDARIEPNADFGLNQTVRAGSSAPTRGSLNLLAPWIVASIIHKALCDRFGSPVPVPTLPPVLKLGAW